MVKPRVLQTGNGCGHRYSDDLYAEKDDQNGHCTSPWKSEMLCTGFTPESTVHACDDVSEFLH